VTEDEPIDKVIQIMLSRRFKRIPVVRGKTPVGIIARNDLLKLMAHKMSQPEKPGPATIGGLHHRYRRAA